MVLLLPPEMMGLVGEAIAVPGVVLSGAGAAAAWELPVLGACPGPLVSVPMSWSRARPGGLRPHRTQLRDDEVRRLGDTRVTSPLRTVLELAPRLSLPAAVSAMDAALHRHLVSHQQLRTAAETSRGPGASAVRRAVRLADARAQSPFESISRVAVVEAGWGPVVPQCALGDDLHHFDLGLPWARVLGECQGREFHGEWVDVCRDYDHSVLVARRRGWGLVPWVWRDMWPHPQAGLLKLLSVLVAQPGRRCRRLRERHLRADGSVGL